MDLSRIKKLLSDDRFDEKYANESDYLSKETINRRRDQNLINHITSTLYRLELESVKPSFDVKLRTGLHRRPYASRVRRHRDASPAQLPVANDDGLPVSARQFNGYSAVVDTQPAAVLSKRRQAVANTIERSGSEVPDGGLGTTRLRERSQQPQPQQQRHSMYETLGDTGPTSDTYYKLLHLQSAIGNYAALPRNWRQEFDHIAYRIANQSDDTYNLRSSADLASSAANARASIQHQQHQQPYQNSSSSRGVVWTKWRPEAAPSVERSYKDEWTTREKDKAELDELMTYMTPASSADERFLEHGTSSGLTNGYVEDADPEADVETIFHNPFGGRRSQSVDRYASHQNGHTSSAEYNDLIKRLHL